jgi:GNAT superfamily N-acetyltransferase
MLVRSRATSATLLPEVAARRLAGDEIGLWVELRNAVDPQLPVTREGVERGIQHEQTLAHFLGFVDGRPAGAALCLEQGDLRHTDVAVAFFGVLPAERRRGLGLALYRTCSEHARSLGKTQLQVDLWEDDHDGRRFVNRRGFVEVERFARVRLDLEEVRLPESAHPPGVEIVPLERCLDLAPQLFEIAREAAADMPSADPIEFSYDDWYRWEIRRETLRHDLGQVALANGQPVGFGSIYVIGESRQGWNSITAVRRSWRRRGVATAIKRAQIEAAKDAGLTSLTTFSELRNIPMRTLNERLGYRPLPDQLRLRGPLA